MTRVQQSYALTKGAKSPAEAVFWHETQTLHRGKSSSYADRKRKIKTWETNSLLLKGLLFYNLVDTKHLHQRSGLLGSSVSLFLE